MKKTIIWVLFLAVVGDLSAYYSEDWPDKRLYYAGRIGDCAVQFDLSWDGDNISGHYILDNKERKSVKGVRIKRFDHEIELSNDDLLIKLSKDEFGIGYTGNAICKSDTSTPVYIEPVAEYVLRSIKFPDRVEVNCYFPVFYPVNEVTTKVNSLIQKDIDEIDLLFKQGVEKFSCDSAYGYFRWSLKNKYQIRHYSPSLISVISKYRQNTGGASGQLGTNGINVVYDGKEAKKINISDILNNKSYMLQISKIVRSKLVKKVSNGIGFLPDTDEKLIEKIEHFSLSNLGISFHFAKYVVDCGAAGEYEVLLGWNGIAELVAKDSLLRDFYHKTIYNGPCEGKVKAEDYK